MIYAKIKNLPDLKVKTSDGKLIGYITERNEGFLLKVKGFKFPFDNTLEQAKQRTEAFCEVMLPYLDELTD